MKIKQFLKPDWRKIVIAIVLFAFLFYSFDGKYPIDYMYIAIGGLVETGGIAQLVGLGYGYNWFYFVLDVLIWIVISYLLSCLLVWIYDKIKKKK